MPSESSPLLPENSPQLPQNSRGKKSIAAAVLILFLCITVILNAYSKEEITESDNMSGVYQLLNKETGLYIRVDNSNGGALTLSERIPWLSGSNIEFVYVRNLGCYKLRSTIGKWVVNSAGVLRADAVFKEDGECIKLSGHGEGIFSMSITVNEKEQYISLSNSELYLDGVFSIGLIVQGTAAEVARFEIKKFKPTRGVNLGGWFIPEYWMIPSFYAGTGLIGNASLCNVVKINRSLAEERISANIATWINESDIAEIASLGFTSVRLPIGYWNIIKDPYRMFAPLNTSISIDAIDWCFRMCEKYNLSVLVDLHGAPGSQNGMDHSGCQMSVQWASEENVQLSLKAIEAISKRYGDLESFLGVEVLNEPSYFLEQNNHSLLLQYYQKAYSIVRKHSATALVVFNELYPEFYYSWNHSLQEPGYYNVVMDLHLYDWQV